MTREEMVKAIAEAIENMDDGEAVAVWNEYCNAVNRYDDRIEYMDSLPEIYGSLSGDDLFNLLNRFYFGQDENNNNSCANPNRDYFFFNGYGNIITTDFPKHYIEIEEVAKWIANNGDPLGCDDIEDILVNASEDD